MGTAGKKTAVVHLTHPDTANKLIVYFLTSENSKQDAKMQTEIHPTYYADAVVSCACGAEYHVGSTRQEAKVAICAQCHPFYTGKQKFVDTEGRVDRFRRRYNLESQEDEE
jgi:large subunit ribosomal protein L31